MLGNAIFAKAVVLVCDGGAHSRGIGAQRVAKPAADFKGYAFALPMWGKRIVPIALEHLLAYECPDFAHCASIALRVAYDLALAIGVGFEFEGIFCPARAVAPLIGAYDEPLAARLCDCLKHCV